MVVSYICFVLARTLGRRAIESSSNKSVFPTVEKSELLVERKVDNAAWMEKKEY